VLRISVHAPLQCFGLERYLSGGYELLDGGETRDSILKYDFEIG
jgi:hypothetical protein